MNLKKKKKKLNGAFKISPQANIKNKKRII